jgi:hypothetical protein
MSWRDNRLWCTSYCPTTGIWSVFCRKSITWGQTVSPDMLWWAPPLQSLERLKGCPQQSDRNYIHEFKCEVRPKPGWDKGDIVKLQEEVYEENALNLSSLFNGPFRNPRAGQILLIFSWAWASKKVGNQQFHVDYLHGIAYVACWQKCTQEQQEWPTHSRQLGAGLTALTGNPRILTNSPHCLLLCAINTGKSLVDIIRRQEKLLPSLVHFDEATSCSR